MCRNCGNRSRKLLMRLGFRRRTDGYRTVLFYGTHRMGLEIEPSTLSRHHVRLTLLALVARILG